MMNILTKTCVKKDTDTDCLSGHIGKLKIKVSLSATAGNRQIN